MIKILLVILLALPLVSFGVVPPSHTVYWTRINVQTSAAAAQECTYENAASHSTEVIYDDVGLGSYPFGQVRAWSCTSKADFDQQFNANLAALLSDRDAFHAWRDACLKRGPLKECGIR